MRRVGGLWPEVVSFENLLRAARAAARGKRDVAGVARFLERLEPELLAIQRRLLEGTWTPGPVITFTIRDPKERLITVAPFEDRVVHHALIDVLEPHFERRMVHESFACRKGKGTHATLDHAQRCVRRFPWFLKLDVRKCFPSRGQVESARNFVIRGGSFNNDAENARSANRNRNDPSNRNNDLGVRPSNASHARIRGSRIPGPCS